jgi:transketolase
MNPLLELYEHGQSYWLDNLTRDALQNCTLARRVRHEGLRGVTSNPRTFCDAVLENPLYDRDIAKFAAAGLSAEQIAEALAVGDVRDACDVLRPAYDASEGQDGFVSLEVSPRLAHDTEGSVAAARRLAEQVGRSNLMIKIPGTRAGIAAVEQLIYEGINVNVTLLFSVERYADFAQAYYRALEARQREGKSLRYACSVASFFLGRIDTLVDELLSHRLPAQRSAGPHGDDGLPFGKTALASARLAYEWLRADLAETRWAELAKNGARVQRLLWASTGVKNPKYRDVKYVEPLIGPLTVSTMPEETISAFADHGKVGPTLERGFDEARATIAAVERAGIDLRAVATELENDGIKKFREPFEKLLDYVDRAQHKTLARSSAASLRDVATNIRRDVVRMTTEAGSGHPTSSLSCADLVACLFFHQMRYDPADPRARGSDQFVLSKGHAAPVLWAALSEAEAIDENPLSLRKFQSTLEGHPTPRNPWIRFATGSLGQGLSFANGVALANRLDGIEARIYCLMGDGECSEGSVWEAAQFAALNRLSNVVAIVDVNGLGQSGLAPYRGNASIFEQRFKAFGWKALVVDGHDIGEILDALHEAERSGPTAIIARTVKGKGVSFLEGEPGWHGKALDPGEMRRALDELGQARSRVAVTPRRVGDFEPAPRPATRPRIDVRYASDQRVATRTGFGNALAKLGALHPELVVLDGDVKDSTREIYFANRFPERFVECYIAEQNMLGVGLGLAKSDKIPVVGTFAAFLLRAADFVRMASYSQPPHLVLCGSHAGVSVGEDGPSQMGLEDLAIFRALRGVTVLYPSDAVSAERLAEEAVLTPGIVYVRTTRPDTPILYANEETFPVGGSKLLRSSPGDQLTIVAAGITVHEALAACESLKQRNVSARVIDAYSVKPLDIAELRRAALETGRILVVEDHAPEGGLGEAVAAAIGGLAPVECLAVRSAPRSGSMAELLAAHGICRDAIADVALALIGEQPPASGVNKLRFDSDRPPSDAVEGVARSLRE